MEQQIPTNKIINQGEEKIITPKVKRLFPSLKINRNYSSSTKVEKKPFGQSLNLENISLEEINKDFLRYSQGIKDEDGQNELMQILCSSTKECSFDSQYHKANVIERPENPFEKNFPFINNDDLWFNKLIEEDKSVNFENINLCMSSINKSK